MSEVWKDIEGYEGLYKVSNLGRIWSCRYKKCMRKNLCKGYERVNLKKDGIEKTMQVHRLVALAFLPNPQNKPEVNHIDENKENNNVDNLEWVTSKENANYGTRNDKIKNYVLKHPVRKLQGKKVAQIDKETGKIISIYESTTEAARINNFHQGNICWCCNGRRNEANGYKWKYIDKE
ncbi:NUMOD4 domain-containing protein [Claveliimonas bilis]|uniref:NUMOD4 domain-containing protein n=1 Tax=Claveliimonas bilis TaxID=3028070 RepID=UPI00292D72C8|nr:NUMOD4 domain-containing protein [Claveliimonas bilis]BDZ79129.1 endonuclease [Claveliimonas bilis]